MEKITRRVKLHRNNIISLSREWLTTNGLGAYASGTLSCTPTRRYHGYLIAALPYPMGRAIMLNHLSEILFIRDKEFELNKIFTKEHHSAANLTGFLKEFRLDYGIPYWYFKIGNIVLEKRLHFLYLQNTVHVTYTLIKGDSPVRIELRPFINFRYHNAKVDANDNPTYYTKIENNHYEIYESERSNLPPLKLMFTGSDNYFTNKTRLIKDVYYCMESERGYDSTGSLWSPGIFASSVEKDKSLTLVASTESWHEIEAVNTKQAIELEYARRKKLISIARPKLRQGIAAELVFAADQFVVRLPERVADAAMIHASGEQTGTVIAGYYWFTDWGRDTMISLEGLTLITGRYLEASRILKAFSFYIKDGLIPNLFPEGSRQGVYNTADASLWYFHAVNSYLEATKDYELLKELLPKLKDIIDHHLHGTLYNIKADPEDGLLSQGQKGVQLTWMDAKVDDWVVTPRRGKAVEINALWYNAFCLLGKWIEKQSDEKEAVFYRQYAEKIYKSFNSKFWYEEKGYLYDVIDGENGSDPHLRPNQIFAISLPHPVLNHDKWEKVLTVVKNDLLTPLGLRSLSPEDPDYKSKYFGDRRNRDAAYHQGTVWPWLLGPFIDAWLKTYPEKKSIARSFLREFNNHLSDSCIGSISEVTDAEFPYVPRGCISQAWSVAEILKSYLKTS